MTKGTSLAAAVSLLLLSACTVGPDFERPVAAASQPADPARMPAGDWWSIFRSAKLDAMMRKAIADNLDLVAADATIAQANEAVAAVRGGLRPQIDVGANGGRQGSGGSASGFYAVGQRVSFDFDLFGGTKRAVEQQTALADLQTHRYEAAHLTLTGDVVTQALMLASARAQIDAVQTLLANDRRTLDLIRIGHIHGSATQSDIALAAAQLAQDETLLPPLAQQRDVARHALSVLAGKEPAEWTAPEFDLMDFALPADLPAAFPSELARERPDILAAEARLHAASAAIGIATADLYPHLQLSAALSATGPEIGTLWSVAAGLAGPLFHGGALKAHQRGSEDGYRASLAGYRQTVVRSLGQVADILRAIDHDADEYVAQERALRAAETSLGLNESGYRAGEIDVLKVLDAQRAYQRALLGRIKARTAQYLDAAQLSVALGGNARGAFERKALANAAQ